MNYEELITELCDVIKESEVHASQIYEHLENIENNVADYSIIEGDKDKLISKINDILGVLQHQDFHRQKIERVVNLLCEKNGIDKEQYNLAPSKNINKTDDNMSEEELEELIKSMQN